MIDNIAFIIKIVLLTVTIFNIYKYRFLNGAFIFWIILFMSGVELGGGETPWETLYLNPTKESLTDAYTNGAMYAAVMFFACIILGINMEKSSKNN